MMEAPVMRLASLPIWVLTLCLLLGAPTAPVHAAPVGKAAAKPRPKPKPTRVATADDDDDDGELDPVGGKVRPKAKGPKRAPPKAPTKAAADDEDDEDDEDAELNLRNIVKTATKSETTIQEAPTVISVLPASDIEAFGYRNLLMVMRTTPGFLDTRSQNDVIPLWTVRGITQAVLFMKDGLSLFDPVLNIVPPPRRMPIETIRRIEIMTNPGGVLWGANSFLGIVNVITKDAEDINGFEFALGAGTGPGDNDVVRPYFMYGQVFPVSKGQFKVFTHLSFEFFRGPEHFFPRLNIFSPPPRLNGPALYANQDPFDQASHAPFNVFGQFDGKLAYVDPSKGREIRLGWQWTFTELPGTGLTGHARSLSIIGGALQNSSSGLASLSRNNLSFHNSFIYLQYKERFWKKRIGLNVRGFYTRFERRFDPVVIFPFTPNVLRGLSMDNTAVGHRSGATFDMDFVVHPKFKVLAGGEAFYEWVRDADISFRAPLDDTGQFQFNRLPLICPFEDRNGTGLPQYDPTDPNNTNYIAGCRQPFIFDSDRTVFAGFLSLQGHPVKRLTLDAGVRVQAAPLGNVGYDPVLLYSGAAVLRLWKQLFLKVNYSRGFRAPIFNNTSGNPGGVEYAGNPNIKPEFSQAITGEFNAKLLRNKGLIRQWDIRADYSYTILTDRIVILGGTYQNVLGNTAIHSVEFLSQLYLRGGHSFVLAYTWLRMHAPGEVVGGSFRSVPNHWFTLGAVFNLFKRKRWQLDANTTLRIVGAFEDPNRVPGPDGSAPVSAVAFDRVPPAAEWTLGLRLRTHLGRFPFELKANVYNVVNGNFTAIDPNYALTPRTENQPVPRQRFYFFLQAKFQFPFQKTTKK